MLERDCVILGSRDFSLPDVPPKSRMGNRITSFVFRTGCGIRLQDTQTGLRAFPARVLPFLIGVQGERFEYETNMLLEMKRANIPFAEHPIETVYDDNNRGTHFRPFRDAVRIYGLILKYIASSLASFLLDIGLFYVVLRLLGPVMGEMRILGATVIARLFSSFANFNMNKRLVFSSHGSYRRSLLRYYALCVVQMLLSAGLVQLFTTLSTLLFAGPNAYPNNTLITLITLLKVLVDTLLFFCSFHIQRAWVFREDSTETKR